jgi:hypothetical protein
VSPIARAREAGLVTADGRVHALDAVVLATGFETTRFLAPMRVFGREGRELEAAWRAGAEAYLGMMVGGFPNLFVLYGPNTNLAHNSIVLMLEAQAHYVTRCLSALARRGARTVEPRERAMQAFSGEMGRRFAGSIWEGRLLELVQDRRRQEHQQLAGFRGRVLVPGRAGRAPTTCRSTAQNETLSAAPPGDTSRSTAADRAPVVASRFQVGMRALTPPMIIPKPIRCPIPMPRNAPR